MNVEWQAIGAIIATLLSIGGFVWGVFSWALSRTDTMRQNIDTQLHVMREDIQGIAEQLDEYLKKEAYERDRQEMETRLSSINAVMADRFDRLDSRIDRILEYLTVSKGPR